MSAFVNKNGFLTAPIVIVFALATPVSGQTLRDAIPPAELPPSSFSGGQFVDSRGCVFIRAGFDGTVQWVPRVTRDGSQICGLQPTFGAGNTPAPNVAVPTAPTWQGVTRAEACAESAATGRQFRNSATGLPLVCDG